MVKHYFKMYVYVMRYLKTTHLIQIFIKSDQILTAPPSSDTTLPPETLHNCRPTWSYPPVIDSGEVSGTQ